MPILISLFTGAGGLDLGLEKAGFDVRLCVENGLYCQKTLKKNRPRWRLADPPDIFKLSPSEILRQAQLKPKQLDLLAGGPPCQPFSKAGYWHRGDSLRLKDPRAKTLKSYMSVVEALLPRVILLENVEGIQFSKKDEAMQLLISRFQQVNRKHKVSYKPIVLALNMADYGVPQIRRRVLLIAARDGEEFELPLPTHGPKTGQPYITAWDAIGDLDNLEDRSLQTTGRWGKLLASIPEGCNYQWHTDHGGGRPIFGFRSRYWSFLLKLAKDKPSWTIQASPGPSTGPFHWKNRLLSARELLRLQTFPNDYEIVGSRRAIQSQIGNAVPPLVGELIGKEIRRQLFHEKTSSSLVYAISHHKSPPREQLRAMPRIYVSLIGRHRAHPGVGKGPGAMSRVPIV